MNDDDEPPVLKEEAIALAKAGDLPGALAAANTIEDTEERAAALEAIATATAEKEPDKAPPAVDVAQKRTNTNTGVGIGVLLQVGGLFIAQLGRIEFGEAFILLGLFLILASIPPLVWGCMNYAEAKGYSKEVGLVGLIGIIGLLVLAVLPDKFSIYLPVPRKRKKVGWISLMLGIALIVYGFGLLSWIHSSPERKTSYELAKYGIQLTEGTDRLEPISWHNRLLYHKAAVGFSILLGGCLIIASLVMLLYRRNKPSTRDHH